MEASPVCDSKILKKILVADKVEFSPAEGTSPDAKTGCKLSSATLDFTSTALQDIPNFSQRSGRQARLYWQRK